jgi:hypothetical protein
LDSLATVAMLRPFRCRDCGYRFYRFQLPDGARALLKHAAVALGWKTDPTLR